MAYLQCLPLAMYVVKFLSMKLKLHHNNTISRSNKMRRALSSSMFYPTVPYCWCPLIIRNQMFLIVIGMMALKPK